MRLCNKCNEPMKMINSCNGSYLKCIKCGNIDFPTEFTKMEFGTNDDNELDYISDRGRD